MMKLRFDSFGADQLVGSAEAELVALAATTVETKLEETENGIGDDKDSFKVLANVYNQVVYDPSPTKNGSRRLTSGLEIDLELFVSIRSRKSYNSVSIGRIVQKAFDTEAERRAFYEKLQSLDPAFDSVNYMDVIINGNKIILQPKKDSGVDKTVVGLSIGLGCSAAIGILGGALLCRRRRRQSTRGLSLRSDQPALDGNCDDEYFYPDQPMRT